MIIKTRGKKLKKLNRSRDQTDKKFQQLFKLSKEYESSFVNKITKTNIEAEPFNIRDFFKKPDLFQQLKSRVASKAVSQDQLQGKIKQFQRDWVNRYSSQKLCRVSSQEWQSFVSLCIGGYGLQNQQPIKMSQREIQQKFKSFYTLLSTHQSLQKVQNMMSILSNKLQVSHDKYPNKSVEQIVLQNLNGITLQNQTESNQPSSKINRPVIRDKVEQRKHIRSRLSWQKQRMMTAQSKAKSGKLANSKARTFSQGQLKLSQHRYPKQTSQYKQLLSAIFSNKKSDKTTRKRINSGIYIQKNQEVDQQQRALKLDPNQILLKYGFDNKVLAESMRTKKSVKRLKTLDKIDLELYNVFKQKRNVRWDLNQNRVKKLYKRPLRANNKFLRTQTNDSLALRPVPVKKTQSIRNLTDIVD